MLKHDLSKVITCEIVPFLLAAHSSVVIELNLNRASKISVWRFNNSLLMDQMFKEKMAEVIKAFLEINDNSEINPVLLWETAKATLRGEIIAYSSWRKKLRENKQMLIENKIQKLQELKGRDKTIEKELNDVKKELESINSEDLVKIFTFAKQLFYDNSPKAQRILASKIKKNKEKAAINIIMDNTMPRRGGQEILSCFRNYYENLYNSEVNNLDKQTIASYLDKLSLVSATEAQNENLVKNITQTEIIKIIENGKLGKCPGEDGYTYEFYKDYKYFNVPVLHRVFNEVLQTGKWPDTWKNAIITVIAKEGKDPKQCSSYRPISLLNVDQKIFTSIMANRLLDILPFIINLDQTGFVKNRFLSDNVRRTLNVIDYSRKTKQQMIVLTLDAEKAFD